MIIKKLGICIALAAILCLFGCQSTDNSEEAMKAAYIEQRAIAGSCTTDELTIESYGTYDGCTVAYINGPFMYTQAKGKENVGQYVFHYPDGQRLWAYKDGTYKSLPEAYDAGWLTDEAVAQVHEKHG